MLDYIKPILLTFTLLLIAAEAGAGQKQIIKKGYPPVVKQTPPIAVDTRPDVSIRPILYIGNPGDNSEYAIDPSKDRKVSAGTTFNVKPGRDFSPRQPYADINAGIVLTRKGGDLKKTLKTKYACGWQVGIMGSVPVTFAAGEATVDRTLRLWPYGQNGVYKVTCIIDPESEVTESNEKNNTVEFKLNIVLPGYVQ